MKKMYELIPYSKILEIIAGLFTNTFKNAKTEKEKKVIRLINHLAIVFNCVFSIDNRFRLIISKLEMFSQNWDKERREKVVNTIQSFANDETLINSIRMSLQSIKHQENEKEFESIKSGLMQFINVSNKILEDVGDIGDKHSQRVTPFPSRENLIMLIHFIENGKSESEVKFIKSNAKAYRSTIGLNNITELRELYIEIKDKLMKGYPSIQDFGNAVNLEDFSKKKNQE